MAPSVKSILFVFVGLFQVFSLNAFGVDFYDGKGFEIHQNDRVYHDDEIGKITIREDGEFITWGTQTQSFESSETDFRSKVDPDSKLSTGDPYKNGTVLAIGPYYKVNIKTSRISSISFHSKTSRLESVFKSIQTTNDLKVGEKIQFDGFDGDTIGIIKELFSNGKSRVRTGFTTEEYPSLSDWYSKVGKAVSEYRGFVIGDKIEFIGTNYKTIGTILELYSNGKAVVKTGWITYEYPDLNHVHPVKLKY
jgi:hypothetical protein